MSNITTITLDAEQKTFIKDKGIKLSQYIREKIAEDMNKGNFIDKVPKKPIEEPKEVINHE